ncbi:MAG: helix-turn-helix domain-containing protein [Limisphaerales bacterium]
MSLEAAGNHSWTEIAEEVGCSRQPVYRVLKPNKAKEHRNNDITKCYTLLTILKDTRQHILTELSFEQQV